MNKVMMLIIAMMSANSAMAENMAVDEKTANTIRQALPQTSIANINKTPMKGVYELQIGNRLLYSDAQGRFVIRGGEMLDVLEQKNLTRARLEDINRVDWATLPLEKAIVSGDKKAKKKLAIFTDPDCPYCKGLEKTLKELKGVKVYTFLYPLEQLHPRAKAKSEAIWCSKNRHETLQKVMLEGYKAKEATCKTPIADIAALARKLNITGTPGLIAGDGRRMSGAPRTAKELQDWVSGSQ
ncbi:thiol:disulfide interchange protein DsbC [Mariprofundus micogutta]|uniref:Thiol:disulfide interchange protein n=1 Tax=Mariprofundus micogutta TaxID=1921010 RepID=A0A1L8CKQ2_9PROT|nr:DsbC family protein [Mariprofundus micogutta]GAV19482.1 thiol:disulfide interchange protein DsbC [Mariprofundus micogutta]